MALHPNHGGGTPVWKSGAETVDQKMDAAQEDDDGWAKAV